MRVSDESSSTCIPSRPPLPATVKNILKHDGIRGMYRGLGPTILGYLPTWAIYFAVYDGIKRNFGERPLDSARHVYPAAQVKGYQPLAREHPWTLHILSAMAAGATSTVCTNPLWVIKTRFMVRPLPSPPLPSPLSRRTSTLANRAAPQTQPREERRYRHTLDAALTIYRTEGWRAFFRGLLPSLLGITHVAVQFPLYEHLKRVAGECPMPSLPATPCRVPLIRPPYETKQVGIARSLSRRARYWDARRQRR